MKNKDIIRNKEIPLTTNITLATIKIDSDYKVNVYETTIISLIDIFGMVGGVFELFQVVSGFLIGILTDRLFKINVIRTKRKWHKNAKATSKWFSYPVVKMNMDLKKEKRKRQDEKAKGIHFILIIF